MGFRPFFSVVLLAVATHHAHGLDISGCDDFTLLDQAFEEDTHVVATISNDLECDVWTTVEVPENKKLTVEGVDKDRRIKFYNVRFEVAERDDDGEMDLIFDTKVKFFATIDADSFLAIQDVDGGVLNVGRGASVSFADYIVCRGIRIVSAMAIDPEGGFEDYSDHFVYGGCWYNEGTIEVAGLATFKENDNDGGGEAPPGNGGAICNKESGSINFLGGVSFKENTCRDDDEGRGGAIYNEGTIVIHESAVFANNYAEGGGAIYNDGGIIEIYTEETVSFFNNRAPSSVGLAGHIENTDPGSITFGCPLKVLRGTRGIQTSGHVSFLDTALFKNVENTAIVATTGSSFTGLSNATFKSNERARVEHGILTID